MRRIISAIATGAVAFALVQSVGAVAGATAAQGSTPHRHKTAMHRHRAPAYRRSHPRAYATYPAPVPPQGWYRSDPSVGPFYGLWYVQRQGLHCVEDLGYGRWRYCDAD